MKGISGVAKVLYKITDKEKNVGYVGIKTVTEGKVFNIILTTTPDFKTTIERKQL